MLRLRVSSIQWVDGAVLCMHARSNDHPYFHQS